MAAAPATPTPARMNAAEKAIAVLEAVGRAGGPHPLADIAARAGVAKPNAHYILQTLIAADFVTSDGAGRYGAGTRLLALASEVAGDARGRHNLTAVLEALQAQTRQTVHLAVRSGIEAVYLAKVDSPQPYQMASRVGMRVPLHCTSIGKCLLAWLGEAEREQIVAQLPFDRRTSRTLTTPQALLEELVRVRERGFSIDDEENETSIRCVGAPVLDPSGRPTAAVSVSALTHDLSPAAADALGPVLISAAQGLSRHL
jgi:IclR family transcriptional regulator, acetate operon repressor